MGYPEPVVFVVDDDDSVRIALARLIRSAGYRVEVFASAGEFLATASLAACPSCLVLDVQLPDIDGLQLQRELDGACPIIFITGYGDISMTVHAMKAGASDFLPKPVRDAELLGSIELALERARQLYAMRCERDALCCRFDRLTPREREVMALISEGRLNKQIAGKLGTVEQTIKVHRARVMTKMEVTSVAELVHILDRIDMLSAAENRQFR
ncbi:response regulator transcription factor [Paraburkholderia susongensis]|uniref:Two component transcriptional regulator, LuxR family n=1 Tax=Paraburkholderia susongensis TaxID=1515439 RepID=A0A1X7M1R8_9BURK|nr:response regulator [Paraburkholderia susongensis]SMG59473.1 two component transcriptional regulator, LuxR family [Paraburkholderia susongensis]